MLEMNLQFFGGRGGSGSRNSSSNLSEFERMEMRDRAKTEAYNYERYHLGYNETSVSHFEIESIGEPDDNGMADVTYTFDVHVSIPLGADPETGIEQYERDIETRRNTRRMRVVGG